VTLAQAMERAGHDPEGIGADPERLARIGAFVELHIEQGRALVDTGHPIGVASAIWPHGRWRFDFHGEANHAGTTRLEDRRDPMLTYANTVLAARKKARLAGALATFGKVAVEPNGVNAIPSLVRGWLDSRAADQETLDEVVAEIERAATERGTRDGVRVAVTRESFTPVVDFSHALRDRLTSLLSSEDDTVPVLPTGAGHDAGILSAAVPTAMLYVRNPTGVSHSPAETAEEDDCVAGVTALADVLEGLLCR
jgi:beta-ureidopropionase / N-carbamoyl-L-amino-acid hydrolase